MIDLSTCKHGDGLVSKHGAKLIYKRPTNKHEYLDHVVKFVEDGEIGTRTNDGFVFRNLRNKTDHDIVKIIGQ